MSWPTASSDSASETVGREVAATHLGPWDTRDAGQDADEGEWFGAFYVPRFAPALHRPNWSTDSTVQLQSRTEGTTEEEIQYCISCGIPTKDLVRLVCGHLWDRECLLARIELALRWEGNWPARCCEKIDEAEMQALAPLVGESIVRRYLDKDEEMETPRDKRIYCANPRCSAFIGEQGRRIHLDSCLNCNTSTCLACGQTGQLHEHDECPSDRTIVSHEELISAGKLQQCPGCPEVVELRDACNHITLVIGELLSRPC
jgi:IBR domain, a half RING-finger domain